MTLSRTARAERTWRSCGQNSATRGLLQRVAHGDLQQGCRCAKLVANKPNILRHSRDIGISQVASIEIGHHVKNTHSHDCVELLRWALAFFSLQVAVDGFALASNFLIIRLSLTGSMKYSDDPLSESGTDDSMRVVALFAECGLSCCFATVLLTIAMF